MFNIAFLKTYTILARTRSFRGAARANAITQSAVSQQIRALEKRLNKRLIDRAGGEVHLTPAGKVFLSFAENIIEQFDEMLPAIQETTESMDGMVKVATIYSLGLHRLQPMIRKFLKKYPKINVHLEYYHNDIIYEKIINKTFDFGVVAYPKSIANLKTEFIAEEELVLIQSPQRPAFKKKAIQANELNGSRYITLSHTTPTGKEIAGALKKIGVDVQVINEFENLETLKSAVMVGMGCAFAPKNILKNEIAAKDLEIIKVKDLSLVRPIGALTSKNKTLSKAKKAFLKALLGQ